MKESLVCHALCSDPACESEHASECLECGSRTCVFLDPVCSCEDSEPVPEEFAHRSQEPRRFMFRFTYREGARA